MTIVALLDEPGYRSLQLALPQKPQKFLEKVFSARVLKQAAMLDALRGVDP